MKNWFGRQLHPSDELVHRQEPNWAADQRPNYSLENGQNALCERP